MNNIVKNNNSNPIMTYLSDERFKEQLKAVLPKYLTPERMVRIALTELRLNPKIMHCDPKSFVGAVIRCAQMGLEPSSERGHVYLIPYGKECKVTVGYKGMLYLAARANIYIETAIVYENDKFEFTKGLHPNLIHTPALKNKGEMIGAYAIGHFPNQEHQIPMFEFMSKEEIDAIMNTHVKSTTSSPWKSDYDAMARKTVIRRFFKYLPIVSDEIQYAVSTDEKGDINIQNNAVIVEDIDDNNENNDVETSSSTSQDLLNKLKSEK